MKTTTIRLTEELDKHLTEFAKANELSKNQVVKKALRELLLKANPNPQPLQSPTVWGKKRR